ncbi:Holliday junction DNA helicase RuvA [Candidatus Saccharibacteria bacterium RIFCSPHIGHO2_02_FULL_47_12]|nr:MAG: Holliday junction DNA helicase RuvA [Candidatus Saccharibacteria bacterium RIFCSPHIGHO2_02_FULL_47_12]
MIATLSGVISEKLSELVVLDVNGVGYGLYVTAEDFGRLNTGDKTKLHIYEHIRENTHDLFGFKQPETKALFELLLGVNGVGPKMALNMLSVGTMDEVRQAVASGNVKFLQTASGVGKRVAERVVVDLKDKVGLAGVDLQSSGLLQADSLLLKDEAVEALVSLGYTPQDASQALKSVDKELSTQDRVKLALRTKA